MFPFTNQKKKILTGLQQDMCTGLHPGAQVSRVGPFYSSLGREFPMSHITSDNLQDSRPVSRVAEPYALAAEEDRCAVRHRVAVPAKMRFSGCSNFAVKVTDLSLAGFACDALVQAHPGTRCWLTLPGLTPLEAEVVHRSNLGIGCAFHTMLNAAVLNRYTTNYPA